MREYRELAPGPWLGRVFTVDGLLGLMVLAGVAVFISFEAVQSYRAHEHQPLIIALIASGLALLKLALWIFSPLLLEEMIISCVTFLRARRVGLVGAKAPVWTLDEKTMLRFNWVHVGWLNKRQRETFRVLRPDFEGSIIELKVAAKELT